MRKYLTFFLLTTAISFCQAQQFELKKGTVLNFAVSDLKTVYDFFVTIKAIDSTHVLFDWKKVAGNSKKGSAEITSASLDSATILLFAIDGIKRFTLPGTTLFLSRQQFQKLKKGKCNLGSDASMRGIPIEIISNGPGEIIVNNHPMVIQQVFGTGEANSGKIWVLDNEVFPLVIGYKGPSLTYTLMNISNPK